MHSYEKQINLWVFEGFTVTMVQLKNKQQLLQAECPKMPRYILLALRITECVVLALNVMLILLIHSSLEGQQAQAYVWELQG